MFYFCLGAPRGSYICYMMYNDVHNCVYHIMLYNVIYDTAHILHSIFPSIQVLRSWNAF